MSSRVLIPLLCVGAVALACGPRSRNEASTPKKNGATVAQNASAAPAIIPQGTPRVANTSSSKSPVTATIAVRSTETSVDLTLLVVNTSKKRVEINFPSGQTYDFIVIDSVGREMWRWGGDRMFTQAVRNKLLGAGERLEFQESLKTRGLPPGRYVARATLTSANYPLRQEAEFTVTGTTIASR
jgi:hypothetical protein